MTNQERDATLEARLRRTLNGGWLGQPCYAYRTISSTMDVAHDLARQGAAQGTCVWAETQTAGRGRSGRTWSSPPGGMYLSFILRPQRPVTQIPQLSLVAGLAVAQGIRHVTKLPMAIRWPNDVLFDGKKIAGILVEASTYAVVGIGMNVEMNPHKLPEGATALRDLVAPVPDRFQLAAALMRHFETLYLQWTAEGFAAIRPMLTEYVSLFGQLVHVTTAKDHVEGQAVDLDERGRLLVRLESGVIRPFESGEVMLLR